MEKGKMLNILTSLVNECWWVGTEDRVTKTGKTTIERRLNQLSKALGHGKLSQQELSAIIGYF